MADPTITTLTFKIEGSKTANAEIKVSNQNVMREIFPNITTDTITIDQLKLIEKVAASSGDANVLEIEDSKAGVGLLKNNIMTGNAHVQEHGFLSMIFNCDSSCLKNDYIYVNIPSGTTMAEIKNKYNLPDGSLTNYVSHFQHAPGNRDLYTVDAGVVWFSVQNFAKGNNMSVDEVLAMFGKNN